MQKIIVSSFLAVLLVPGTAAFAQFKNPAKAAKNLASLERLVAQQARGPVVGKAQGMRGPTLVIKEKDAGILSPVILPKQVTPVSKSWNQYVKNVYKQNFSAIQNAASRKQVIPLPFIAGEWIIFGKAFYEDQSALARDLDAFYKGNADTLISPDGRKVKFYALPVNGILYRPMGYSVPVVLNAADYFVIYDVQAQSGKIAENKPEVYNVFKSQYDEIWSAMGASKEFDDLNNLCDAILLAHLHKARVDRLRVASDVKTLVKEGKQTVWKQLNSSMELLSYLQKLPTVRETTKGFKAYVVELPVEGLSWTDSRDGVKHSYTRQDNVMLFFEMGAVGIYPRADIKNPAFFKQMK